MSKLVQIKWDIKRGKGKKSPRISFMFTTPRYINNPQHALGSNINICKKNICLFLSLAADDTAGRSVVPFVANMMEKVINIIGSVIEACRPAPYVSADGQIWFASVSNFKEKEN